MNHYNNGYSFITFISMHRYMRILQGKKPQTKPPLLCFAPLPKTNTTGCVNRLLHVILVVWCQLWVSQWSHNTPLVFYRRNWAHVCICALFWKHINKRFLAAWRCHSLNVFSFCAADWRKCTLFLGLVQVVQSVIDDFEQVFHSDLSLSLLNILYLFCANHPPRDWFD